jgi:hypothetical protein
LVRSWFIQATIDWLNDLSSSSSNYKLVAPYENENNQENILTEKAELIEFLKNLLHTTTHGPWFTLPLVYEPWNKTPYSLWFFGVSGLKKFVVHSDCDGYFTYGDVVDILDLISKIGPYLKKYFEDDDWYQELVDLLEYSYEGKKPICFQ